MGRPKLHKDAAARQRAYAQRLRDEAKRRKESDERDHRAAVRLAKAQSEVRHKLVDWLHLVGVDCQSAAMRAASKRYHPDAGGTGDTEQFTRMVELTEWMKKQIGNPPAFLVF